MNHRTPSAAEARIRRLCSLLLSPMEFDGIDAWRRAVLEGVTNLTGVNSVHFAIAPFDTVDKFLMQDFDEGAIREYMADWHHQDAVYSHLAKLGSGPYTRERYSRIDGFGIWREKTAVWNEWYLPNGVVGVAGAMLISPDVFAQIAVMSNRADDPRVGERAYRQFAAIQPSLEAGVRTLHLLHRLRDVFGAMLDQIPFPVALFDRRGRALHWNRSLTALMDAGASRRSELEGMLHALAGRALSASVGERQPEVSPSLLVGYQPRMTWISHALGLTEPALLVVFEPARAQEATEATAIARGLTPRQAQVAVRVAKGMQTKDIAAELKLGVTTTAHHIERAMKRLGVHNRASVGPALRGDFLQPTPRHTR